MVILGKFVGNNSLEISVPKTFLKNCAIENYNYAWVHIILYQFSQAFTFKKQILLTNKYRTFKTWVHIILSVKSSINIKTKTNTTY